MEDKRRRLILPAKPLSIDTVLTGTSAADIIDDGLQVISLEMTKFLTKVKRGSSLDLKEARVLQGYMKCMVELSKEARERDRSSDLNALSDQEVFRLAKKALQNLPISEASVATEEDKEDDEYLADDET